MKEDDLRKIGNRVINGAMVLTLLASLVLGSVSLVLSVGTAHAAVCKHSGDPCDIHGFCHDDACGCDGNNICANTQ